jgi:hypothetical protein
MRKLAIVLLLVAACTKKQDQCETNADCTDPAFPFCDVDGSFPASGGDKDVCTIEPTDCPVDVCGCTAGSATCGSDGTLTVCNADGMSVTTTMCATGCELPAATCRTIVPSNGLGPALAASASAPAISIPSGATIDTDTGDVLGSDSSLLPYSTTLVAQPSGPTIRVFAGAMVTVGDVTISGSNGIAFVSYGALTVGSVSANASGIVGGPGSISMGACVGDEEEADGSDVGIIAFGAGGGGNATLGGSGGGRNGPGEPGGSDIGGFTPLSGGCAGGGTEFPTDEDQDPDFGGGGGGAIQLVSNTSVEVDGIISVGGGGGQQNSGGGAGGLVIVEAPAITLGPQGGIVANGGGGGGDCPGADATPDLVPGAGGSGGDACDSPVPAFAGGAGATALVPPAPGSIVQQQVIEHSMYGGGGGAVGRCRLATLDGTYKSTSSVLLSVALTTDVIVTQ